ncbi:MAG: hypothetical protein JWN52_5484 [Actinomycetia bacterium]|nr:hypothetical protein [Actinomycetes bacterium]
MRLPGLPGRPSGFPGSPGLQQDPAKGVRYEPPRPVRRRRLRGSRRSLVMLLVMGLFMLSPLSPANAALPDPPGSNPNGVCSPASSPAPEAYGSGTDGMIKPPDYPSDKLKATQPQQLTYYDRYGTAGQNWYAVDMGCSDAMALMGNSVANTVFTLVRAIDRTTITVYQSAASESLLSWLKKTVDGVITGIGKTFNAKYWSWVVILGAIWMAWWGLIRKRASKATEGAIWMVAAMVALIWLIARPADFTTLGTKVSEATSTAFNAALPQSDTKGTTCIPSPSGQNPQSAPQLDSTARNANGLWVALVCKPWLMGEFGTNDPNSKVVKDNADKLLNSQAIDLSENYGGQKVDLGKKSDNYKAVTKDVKDNYPGAYPVFQGKQWTSRLAVAFGGLFAALVAGLLIMVISLALIVVKIAFLLLLVAGPIFLGIGIHPGIGRVIAVRWMELLLSMLLKQAALIGVLALLLWAYGLILAEGLPWGLQIILISLVTFAAFIYRKPFQHLFAAVGYSAVGSRAKSDEHLQKSITEVRKNTAAVATAGAAGASGYRIARWAKRDAESEPAGAGGGTAGGVSSGVAGSDPTGVMLGKNRAAASGGTASGGSRSRAGAPPLNLPSKGGSSTPATPSGGRVAGGPAASSRGPSTKAPSGGSGSGGASSGGSRGGGGVGRPTSGSGGRTTSGGGSSSGGAAGSGSGGSSSGGSGSGGRGWFGGGDGGGGPSNDGGASSTGRGRGRSGGGSGSSGGSRTSGGGKSGGRSSGADVPKPRPAGSSQPQPSPSPGQGGGDRQSPPPLWGKTGREESPSIPFWLRPVDRDD